MDTDGGGSSDNEQYTSKRNGQKKMCHRHTPQQIQRLEDYFKDRPHPDESQRKKLCKELKLEPDQIKFWFQNKRTQSKAQGDRNCNMFLREENEKLQCENEAMLEALKNVICPTCGGPPVGIEERECNLQNLRLENARLKDEYGKISNFVSKHTPKRPTMVDSIASVHEQHNVETRISYETNPPTSHTIEPEPQFHIDIMQLSETAASAVEELKRLFTEDNFWVNSSITGTDMIDQGRYEKFSHAIKHFRSASACIESSRDGVVVPIEASNLIEMFLDSEKWKELFPTIVSEAKTIYEFGSELPTKENCNVLKVIRERLHILSPLVPPREFKIVRCCQQIEERVWIIADVSHSIVDSEQVGASCYKRPSGCLIQSLPNAQSKVMWVEHVEVDDRSKTHKMYKELLCGGSGYGAKRWIETLRRMCERMALSSILTVPTTDWSKVIESVEGRRSVMKVGERMLKKFNEMLTMSGKVDFPQQSKCGVRVSIRLNSAAGQPQGIVISAASSFSIPVSPLQVFTFLSNIDIRQQWDVLSCGHIITELAHVATGSSETDYLTILRPMQMENHGMLMMPKDSDKDEMVMLQDCYMDNLGGMLVYAPLDMSTMKCAVSGQSDPSLIPILPSGFIISSDGRRSTAEDGGTLVTLAFQILVSGKTNRSKEENEKSVDTVSSLISSTVQSIKALLNCPQD
ncbi:Homeobox-leucine zipper protein HDG8 [Cardamine amara subsp. amara]|uniref:Homeobox-leucine zipper protein HDG8 n=1 Tax=Cardamine amara subsp. amara TaxID=228776 RepID=A0ABD1BFP7_CARAN